MIRVLMAWVLLSLAIGFGITAFRALSGKEKWELTKLIAYTLMCSIIALVFLVGIVILF
jgi:hypothetical protein